MTVEGFEGEVLAALAGLKAGQEELGRRLDRLEAGPVSLGFLAAQQHRIVEDAGRARDDMAVLLAVMQRLDGTVQGLVAETRAQHARLDRALRRVDRIEADGA